MKAITTIWLLVDVLLLLTGNFSQGQKCNSECGQDYDCESKKYVCGFDGCCRPLGKNSLEAGESCSHRSDCKEPLQCVGRDPKGKCRILFAGKKKYCEENSNCRKGYYCNLKKKRCEKLRRLGKPCKKSDECSNGHCLPSVFSTSRLYGQIQGRISQYKSYCAVRNRRIGQRCRPKSNHCQGQRLICTLQRGGGFGFGFGNNIRGKRQASQRKRRRPKKRRTRTIRPPQGFYACQEKGLEDGTGLPCNSFAHCPCGEACYAVTGRPIQSPFPRGNATNQAQKRGRCKPAKCGLQSIQGRREKVHCTGLGFRPFYTCKDDKLCLPPQKTMINTYGKQPTVDDFQSRGFGGNGIFGQGNGRFGLGNGRFGGGGNGGLGQGNRGFQDIYG